jgi:hypothetical protein
MQATIQTSSKLMQPSLNAPEMTSSQQVSNLDKSASQSVNHSTAGPRLFNRFILGSTTQAQNPMAQTISAPSQPLQSNNNIGNNSSSKSHVNLQAKCSSTRQSVPGSYRTKENNSGLGLSGSGLRQRNPVYVPHHSNNVATESSVAHVSKYQFRGQSGGNSRTFGNGYVTANAQEMAAKQTLHSHSRSNVSMMCTSADEKN